MSSKEQSVTLLRRNKDAIVAAFNHIGMESVTASTRASMYPELVKWAHGLLDVCVACRRKSDGRHFYFTAQEWQSLTADEQETMLIRGVRLRAEGRTVIISMAEGPACKWSGSATVPFVTTYDSDKLLRTYWKARYETEFIAEYFAGKTLNDIEGAPAAEAALAYRAFTKESDGLEDDTLWAVPTQAALLLIHKYKLEINALLGSLGGKQFASGTYWSICIDGLWYAYYLNMGNGYYGSSGRTTNNYIVRPIAVE